MRIKISFVAKDGKKIRIPVRYNHQFQSMIYRVMEDRKIHDYGYGERNYKLYTFSRPLGKFSFLKKDNVLEFDNTVSWIISSPRNEFIEDISLGFMKAKDLFLSKQKLELNSLEAYNDFEEPLSEIMVKTLSPITIYSTLYNAENKRKTYFYSPYERGSFSQKLKENIIRKYTATHGEPKDKSFFISLDGRAKEIITYYKTILIKGWIGKFRLVGNPELIKLAYDSGLGSRNSQGFGCIELIKGE